MSEPIFSLIFVNFRSSQRLTEALESWKQAFGSMEVEFIVVNNDEGERTILERLAVTRSVQVYHLESNVGFGAACNVGAHRAKGKFLFFLNPDTQYVKGSVEALRSLLESRPRSIGGVKLVDRTLKDETWSSGRFPTLRRLIDRHIFGFPQKPFWKRSIFSYPDWVSGAAFVVPRDFFHALGGFDADFFLYFEDVDLCFRAKACGGVVWRTPFFVVKHQGGASHSRRKEQKRAYYRSQCQYFVKHRPKWEGYSLQKVQKFMLGT